MKTIAAPYQFQGGVHPAYHKEITHADPSAECPVPAVLRVPLVQHLGAAARPLVAVGDPVLRGQAIGAAVGLISATIHAPTSGTVSAIEDGPTPTGRLAPHIVLEADGKDERAPHFELIHDWDQLEPREIVSRVAAAGIVGMGGAGFPTHVKLSPPPDKPIDTLILNGAECEPYLTSDHRTMLEQAFGIWEGIRILRRVLKATTVRIAIEANKPDAIQAMAEAARDAEGDVALVILETLYPQGSEKQQIYAVTGREVPPSGLPMDVGCLVENVGTALAIWNAISQGLPLDERMVTVTGPAVTSPRNFRTRVGTSFASLLEAGGGLRGKVAKVIAGGPMMGFAQHTLDVSATKTTSGILGLRTEDVRPYTSQACIGCGRCNEACPMFLLPSELGQFIEADDIEAAEAANLMDCFECGCCSYACPARRPLVQHMRRAKAAVLLKRRMERTKP